MEEILMHVTLVKKVTKGERSNSQWLCISKHVIYYFIRPVYKVHAKFHTVIKKCTIHSCMIT